MISSKRGVARVGLVWLVIVGVLLLAALAFGFIAQSDLSSLRHELDQAKQEKAALETQLAESVDARRNLSQLHGWYDRASADPSSDVEAVRRSLEGLREAFTDLGPSDKDYETALPKIRAAFDARGVKIAEVETRVQTLQNEVQAAQEALARVQGEKDQVIADLRSQLADEQQNAAKRQQELEGRLQEQQKLVADRDSELRSLRDQMESSQRSFDKEKNLLNSRIAALANTTIFATPEYANNPDGKVLEVSRRLNIGWIDLGANQRLTTGTRFRVEGGPPGNRHFKAWAEVTEVEPSRAEVAFSDLADAFDPVVTGDVVINPLYDPKGSRNAVLAGRFSGVYSKDELIALLQKIGVQVQDELDYTTHFLIVGSELYNDPLTNEPLEEPLKPSALPVYRDAVAQHVQIVPLQDIRDFFRIGPP